MNSLTTETETEMNGYQKIISEATGRTDCKELALIEDSMRHDIFHSTLDWQSRTQLQHGAKEAVQLLEAMDLIEQRRIIVCAA